jgi:hypothetical protein
MVADPMTFKSRLGYGPPPPSRRAERIVVGASLIAIAVIVGVVIFGG